MENVKLPVGTDFSGFRTGLASRAKPRCPASAHRGFLRQPPGLTPGPGTLLGGLGRGHPACGDFAGMGFGDELPQVGQKDLGHWFLHGGLHAETFAASPQISGNLA